MFTTYIFTRFTSWLGLETPGVGLVFNLWIWARCGWEASTGFLQGFFLEYMLSFDNLFVFHVIFSHYCTPEAPWQKGFGLVQPIFPAFGSEGVQPAKTCCLLCVDTLGRCVVRPRVTETNRKWTHEISCFRFFYSTGFWACCKEILAEISYRLILHGDQWRPLEK